MDIVLFCSILSSPLCLEVGFGDVWVSSFLGRCLAEDVASVTSTEMTENLVRAEVRRQLAERCGREALTGCIVLPPQSLPNMTDNESTQRTSVDVLPGRVLRNLPKSALFHLAPCKWCKCFVLVWFLVVAELSQVHWCSGWWCSGFRDVTWQKGPTSHLVSPV